eukprot:5766650-Pleurochrysis_carterae.AAC.3
MQDSSSHAARTIPRCSATHPPSATPFFRPHFLDSSAGDGMVGMGVVSSGFEAKVWSTLWYAVCRVRTHTGAAGLLALTLYVPPRVHPWRHDGPALSSLQGAQGAQ